MYSFTVATYFIMITVSTTGYGDFCPTTQFGMLITMLVLIVTIIMVPTMVSGLLRLILMQSKYKRIKYTASEVDHIVVTGFVSLNAL